MPRAELSAGRRATAADAVKVFCRNPRRDEPGLEECMSVQGLSRLNAGRPLEHERPRDFTIHVAPDAFVRHCEYVPREGLKLAR